MTSGGRFHIALAVALVAFAARAEEDADAGAGEARPIEDGGVAEPAPPIDAGTPELREPGPPEPPPPAPTAPASPAPALPERNGFKAGATWFHPFVELQGNYDSFVSDAFRNPGGFYTYGDWVARPTIGLDLDSETEDVLLTFRGRTGYVVFLGFSGADDAFLNHLAFAFDFEAAINRAGLATLFVGASSSLSEVTSNVVLPGAFTQLSNSAHVALPIHPGDGAVEVTPRIEGGVDLFNPLVPADLFPYAIGNLGVEDNAFFDFGLLWKWKFLPSFAVMVRADGDYRAYFQHMFGAHSLLLKAKTGVPAPWALI